MSKANITLVALGCSKNLVDAEIMSTKLTEAGYNMINDVSDSDIIIINTCGFIESAKKEAIDTILDCSEYKVPNGKAKALIVTGCLSQRYPDEIRESLPEVDAVLGTADYKDICKVVDGFLSDSDIEFVKDVSGQGGLDHMIEDRTVSTTGYAWLKIAEGCLHKCAFCAIPLIRGKYVSRPMESIINEAKNLAANGFKEVVLAAQDTTNYGIELYKRRALPELLRKISEIDGIEVIRVMYGYMDGITDELIAEVRDNPKVAKYFDIPIQYGTDKILKKMNRADKVAVITEKLKKIREEIPGVIIRTTVMVGFPGETDEDFEEFKSNLSMWKFDRLGCFVFSPEEGTKAFDMEDQVPEDVKIDRYNQVYELQRSISAESTAKRMDTTTLVTIDSIAEDGIFYKGRSYGEAPEDDPVIYVIAQNEELQIGERYLVKIVECSDYDMTGVTV